MNKAATRPADFQINTASACRRYPLTGEQEMTLIWSRAWDRQSSISASSSENRSPARDRSLLPSTWLNSWCILGRGSDSSQVLFASEHPAENKYVPDMTCPPGLRGTFGGQEKPSALIRWIPWGSTQFVHLPGSGRGSGSVGPRCSSVSRRDLVPWRRGIFCRGRSFYSWVLMEREKRNLLHVLHFTKHRCRESYLRQIHMFVR